MERDASGGRGGETPSKRCIRALEGRALSLQKGTQSVEEGVPTRSVGTRKREDRAPTGIFAWIGDAILFMALLFSIAACSPVKSRETQPVFPTNTQPVGASTTPRPAVNTQAAKASPVPAISEIRLMPSGYGEQAYLLPAKTGQAVTVIVISDGVPLRLTVTGPSGAQEAVDASQVEGHFRISQQFVIGEDGDYRMMLTKADHTPSTNYQIVVTIQ